MKPKSGRKQTSFEDLAKLIYSTKDKSLLKDFLLGLTTPYERKILARRVDIIKRLLTDEQQEKIAQDLGVGVSTVSRGSRELVLGRFKILKK
ncbi:TPA: Trp operon repressor [Candidatus Saccharibacteria bacterium]|nr:MAG: Trp repressor [Candidatus Saccharibacteria bacterium GW2011_GWA2_46_10]OGL35513.1 MAG: hypothetical protein A3F05_00110 [Candidatus Saccharibacteria bacterium RIFCSPHIGHO2_12_FULL_47_17]HCM52093.1 Trp operon repressor [Candidatus Saccharibacteria bacterium]